MSRFVILAFCLIQAWAVAACTPPGNGPGGKAASVGEQKQAPTGGIPPQVGVVDRNYRPDRDKTPYLGEKRFAAHWTDGAGEQVFIISGRTLENGEGGRAEIFGCQYRKEGAEWTRVWKINDFIDGLGCDLAIHLMEDAIRIRDVDGDGEAETSFIYELDDRCDASPVTAKLLLHHKGKKYAIRGMGQQYLGPPQEIMNQWAAENGQEPVQYKAIDPAYESAPRSVREFASKEWDDFIERENEAAK